MGLVRLLSPQSGAYGQRISSATCLPGVTPRRRSASSGWLVGVRRWCTPLTSVMALDYAKWDDLYDSDEERQKEKRAEEAKRKADLRKAKLNPQPQIPCGMTKEQFAAQYAKMFKQPATNQKEPYKFPETMEEQRAKCDEANELKRRGNELYQKGESPTVEDKATWPG